MSKSGTNPINGIDQLPEWFSRFSEQTSGSKMYQFLSKKISSDNDLLNIASTANQTQPVPNLFLATVNFILYKNPKHALAKLYPNHSGDTFEETNFFDEFKKFCVSHSQEMAEIMNSKLVQTNEVRRCALLLPAMAQITNHKNSEIALIDIGASSGLNLLLDSYSYRYSNGLNIGNSDSNLKITCDSRGSNFLVEKMPKIIQRIGIDLNPLDLRNEDDALWALSLVWPDQVERVRLLESSIKILKQNKVNLIKGDGSSLLPSIVDKIPSTITIFIMHSFTLNQFSQEAKVSFQRCLIDISKTHDVWEIGLEWIGTDTPELYLNHFSSGVLNSNKTLATCHQHGEWISWI